MMKPPQTLAKFSHDATSPGAYCKVSMAAMDNSGEQNVIISYFRVAVENVGTDSHGGDHDTEYVKTHARKVIMK